MAETARSGTVQHPGLILGVARFFHDPRGSIRGVLSSQPTEGRLLGYAVIAAIILMSLKIVQLSLDAAEGFDLMGAVSAQVAVSLFVVPLAYYGLAAIGTLLAKTFGGQGGWRDGRVAFFWAALVSAPVVVVSGLLPRVIEGLPVEISTAITQVGGVFFAWAISQCFAETFGFRQTWLVFAVICGLVMLLILALWGMSAL